MTERKDLIDLGMKIKSVRESMNLTQEQFAQKCGMSKNYIGMLERGERNPSYLTLVQIASKININLQKLIP
jgi:transcriptional regulator with XRE-family HTH domain